MTFRMAALAVTLMAIAAFRPEGARAEGFSLLGEGSFGPSRGALIQARAEVPAPGAAGGSLFSGQEGRSFFAPMPERETPRRALPAGPGLRGALGLAAGGTPAERIRHIIASAEAGQAGYDAVQHGARRRPGKLPTQMTIAEIYDWIRATPGQPHAIGRYQFIPSTLRRLVDDLGIGTHEVFSPRVQDALADLLLDEAGFREASAGGMPRHRFMDNLAKIWAGLPNSTGRSHYHGYAGNRATMAWSRFDAEMAKLFPG